MFNRLNTVFQATPLSSISFIILLCCFKCYKFIAWPVYGYKQLTKCMSNRVFKKHAIPTATLTCIWVHTLIKLRAFKNIILKNYLQHTQTQPTLKKIFYSSYSPWPLKIILKFNLQVIHLVKPYQAKYLIMN